MGQSKTIKRVKNFVWKDFVWKDFEREFSTGYGVPVILSGALERFPALRRWNFEYFRKRFGSAVVQPSYPAPLGARLVIETTLARYLDYLNAPRIASPPKGKLLMGRSRDLKGPMFLMTWRPQERELWADYDPHPWFTEDWTRYLDPHMQDRLNRWVNIGPSGASANLHVDSHHTHTTLAQFVGRKRIVVFPPSDTPYLYDGRVDPANPDLERYPLFRHAHALSACLRPGDLMYLPPDWWHSTTCLDDAIGVSFSFINRTNAGAYFQTLGGRLPFICRDLETESFEASTGTVAGDFAPVEVLFGDYRLRTLESEDDEEVIAKILAHFPAAAVRGEHFLFNLRRGDGERCARILDRIITKAVAPRVLRDAAFHLAALAVVAGTSSAEALLLRHSTKTQSTSMYDILGDLARAVRRPETTLLDLCRLYLRHNEDSRNL